MEAKALEKRILSEQELALYLNVTAAQIRKLRLSGLPVHYIGPSESRDGRYIIEEVIEWLKNRPEMPRKSKTKKAAEPE